MDAGGDAGGLCLHRLGAANLAAFAGDEGVQGHILRLEGGHLEAVLLEDAAQGRYNDALAHVGRGALYHYGLGGLFLTFSAHRFIIAAKVISKLSVLCQVAGASV